MKLNEEKCHLMVFVARGGSEITIKTNKASLKESTEKSLLGMTFDQSVSLKELVKTLCKASEKLWYRPCFLLYGHCKIAVFCYPTLATVHLRRCFMIKP